MIEASTPCFFTVGVVEEVAQEVASLLSAKAASDIKQVSLTSDDFEHDISALASMDEVVRQAIGDLQEVKVVEKFNPMFLPKKLQELDEVLELQFRSDMIKFVGMNGNPFTIKTTDVKQDDTVLVKGQVQFHPFELPSYTDMINADDQLSIN
jgi:hypothetical protein